jgi:hypothetical protein
MYVLDVYLNFIKFLSLFFMGSDACILLLLYSNVEINIFIIIMSLEVSPLLHFPTVNHSNLVVVQTLEVWETVVPLI